MSAPTARLRLLLLALGVTAILGLWYWPEADEPNWAPNPNSVRVSASPVPAAAPTSPEQVDTHNPPPRHAWYAEPAARYGLVVAPHPPGAADTARFYLADLRDTTRSLRALGFVPPSALTDSAMRLAAVSDSAPASRQLAIGSVELTEWSFSEQEDGCTLGIPVALRRTAGGGAPWTLALASGVEPALAPGAWRAAAGTAEDRHEAIRLAQHLLDESTRPEDVRLRDSTGARGPLQLVSLHRFTQDGADILVADVRIEHTDAPEPPGSARTVEQRLLIAERHAGDERTPFRVVWSRQEAGRAGDLATEEPAMLIRLGTERLLTLYTSGHYKQGTGGLFISRVANGRWRVVASWYGGC